MQPDRKIILISNTSFYLYNFRLTFMKSLKKMKYIVMVMAPEDQYSKLLTQTGIIFIPLKKLQRKGVNPLQDLMLFKYIYDVLSKEKPSIVLNFTIKPNIYGSIAAKKLKITCINTVPGLGYVFMKNNLLTFFVKYLYKFALTLSSFTFFQNTDDIRLIFGDLKRYPSHIGLAQGSGIDLDYFKPGIRRHKTAHKNKVIYLMITRMLWHKGVGDFVNAALLVKRKYPEAEFHLLGPLDKDNPSGISLRQIDLWTKSGMIKYLGAAIDVRPYINDADVVVLPSYYREGVPRSILEAMAMKKPVIASDSVGCKDTIRQNINGFLVPTKSPEKLAQVMIKMIEIGSAKRSLMGSNGRKIIQKEFDLKIITKKYLEVITRLQSDKEL